jgi:hypothetical protein
MPRSKSRSRSRSRSRSPKKDEYDEMSLEDLKKELMIAEKDQLLHSEYIDEAVVKDITRYGEYNIKLSAMIEKVFEMIKELEITDQIEPLYEFITDYDNPSLISQIGKKMFESKIKDYKTYSDNNQKLSEKVKKIELRIYAEKRWLNLLEKNKKQ